MKVAAIQSALVFGNVEQNYALAAEGIEKAAAFGTDIIVLSELWNTSFYPENVYELADHNGQRAKAFLAQAAHRYQVNIVGGSVANIRQGRLYNTTYVLNRQGRLIGEYDKVHLFTPGKEDAAFTAGDKINVFELDGVKMASIICYDLRFGEWVRMAALAGAKVLFVPAAWPALRREHWQILNQARAIENQFFVVAVNSCGLAGTSPFGGTSLIIDPWGKILEQAGSEPAIIRGELDLSVIDGIRKTINVFRDRRPELYHL